MKHNEVVLVPVLLCANCVFQDTTLRKCPQNAPLYSDKQQATSNKEDKQYNASVYLTAIIKDYRLYHTLIYSLLMQRTKIPSI